jgi:3-hydroxymyristoyl/3-hydroxydecanoyl-(acyl carrier protein) dehydratase
VLEEAWAESEGSPFLSGVDHWRFRSPVWPDDPLKLTVECLEQSSDEAKFMGRAYVHDRLAAQGELSFSRFTASPEMSCSSPGLIFPISVLIEALAEVGAILALNNDENRGKIIFLAGVENWRAHKPIERGVELEMEAEIVAKRRAFGKGHVMAMQHGSLVAEGDLMFMLQEQAQDAAVGQAVAALGS